MLLYIIRHGDPIYDPDTLTEKGKLQAAALAKRMAAHGLDRVYASPMKRAQMTARPTCDMLSLPYTVEEWTGENHAWDELSVEMPDGEGRWIFDSVQKDVLLREEFTKAGFEWYDMPFFQAVQGKACIERIGQASDDFLLRNGYRREGRAYRVVEPNDRRVAVFCHQGFGTVWLSYLLQIPTPLFWCSFDISHTGVTLLEWKNNPDQWTTPRCLCLSDLSHIFAERLPFQYNNKIDL